MIQQVFFQNHLNLVILQVSFLLMIFLLGVFKDNAYFQIPAAASTLLFMTVLIMGAGAFLYWFKNWATTLILVLLFVLNFVSGKNFFHHAYQAYGLSYSKPPVVYSVSQLKKIQSSAVQQQDKVTMETALSRRFNSTQKHPVVFVCVSGGGKRAALWAMTALQTADSVTQQKLWKNTVFVSGASGGLIGAAFFRQVKWATENQAALNPYNPTYRDIVSSDNLNPLVFSLLAQDFFTGFSHFIYQDQLYRRDRVYTFEEQLHAMTDKMLDKPLHVFAQAEADGEIPVMLITPTIMNDGRKLYISGLPFSFMNEEIRDTTYHQAYVAGVDFHRLFATHHAENLRFLSALRMSATFPYITPKTTLPTEPAVQMMDAGIADNFGLSDAYRFMYVFRTWMNEHASHIVVLSIRDSQKAGRVSSLEANSLMQNLTEPIQVVYQNFENFQDIQADFLFMQKSSWLTVPLTRLELQYTGNMNENKADAKSKRASLSWRLTNQEKLSIEQSVYSKENQRVLQQLKQLLVE